MTNRIITGIDIGTHAVRVIIAELDGTSTLPRILSMSRVDSRGLRQGYIMNTDEAAKSIRFALDEAERDAGFRVREAFVSVGGIGLEGNIATGAAIMSRADGEIVASDVERAMRACETSIPNSSNKAILNAVPIEYKIDGKKVYGRPIGMKGLKLEVKALIITCLEQHLGDLMQVFDEVGIDVLDAIPSPLAASYVSLTKQQRMAGVILANIGAETLSVIVYENDIPISLEVFPIGSTDITNDIALGLRIPLEEAELVKLGKGTHQYPKKKLNDIIAGRLEAMFELVTAHLRKIGKHELLPAGIVLTGGGSGVETIEDIAGAVMRLPSRIPAFSIEVVNSDRSDRRSLKDTSWYVAYGLTVFGAYGERSEGPLSGRKGFMKKMRDGVIGILKQLTP